MKNIIHILYFLSFLIIANPVVGEPTKLLGITTEEYGGNQYLVLEFNGPDIEYVTTERLSPPTLQIGLGNVQWDKGDYKKRLNLAPLVEYSVKVPVAWDLTSVTDRVDVRLNFSERPAFTLELKTNLPEAPRNIMVIKWPTPDRQQVEKPSIDPYQPIKPALVSINFKNADIVDVLRLITTQHGMNLVLGDEITGEVTLKLKDVSLEKAMNTILSVSGYSWFMEDDIVIVKVKTEQLQMGGELDTHIFPLSFLNASAVLPALDAVFSPQGSAIELSSTGSEINDLIMVTDIPSNFELIEKIIRTLDKQNPQINISVKFIETTLKKDETLGINWAVRVDTSLALGLGQLINNSGQKVSLATLAPSTVSALLQVLASDAETRLLQEPQITTFNNSPATITVGTTIPVLVPQAEGSMFGAQPYTYQDQNVNVNLRVLPRINENDLITMSIEASVQAITGYVGAERRPIVSSRATSTNVMVRNGETLMIGGLIFDQDDSTIDKLPYLGDLPFFGRFFKSDGKSKSQNELLIFITPTIISS
tara:strand:+ start:328 stop:1935 length:1608 start_codon:yes stop_codon:yes gene_type:complete